MTGLFPRGRALSGCSTFPPGEMLPEPLPRRASDHQAKAPRSLDDILLDYLASEGRK